MHIISFHIAASSFAFLFPRRQKKAQQLTRLCKSRHQLDWVRHNSQCRCVPVAHLDASWKSHWILTFVLGPWVTATELSVAFLRNAPRCCAITDLNSAQRRDGTPTELCCYTLFGRPGRAAHGTHSQGLAWSSATRTGPEISTTHFEPVGDDGELFVTPHNSHCCTGGIACANCHTMGIYCMRCVHCKGWPEYPTIADMK